MCLFTTSTNPFVCLEGGNHVGTPWVNKTESSDIDTALLEVLQIDNVQVQGGDEEAVVGGDQADLLRLAQHLSYLVQITVEHHVHCTRMLHF